MDTKRWIPFALARDKVRNATNASPEGAAEQLRSAAVELRVRVRFSAYYLTHLDNNLRTEANIRLYPTTADDGTSCEWRTPLDELNISPQEVTHHHIQQHTEWDAEGLEAAMAEIGGQSVKGSRAGKGGRPPHGFWHVLGVEAGVWLADSGAPTEWDLSQAGVSALESFLMKRCTELGFEADPKTVKVWAGKFATTFRAIRDRGN